MCALADPCGAAAPKKKAPCSIEGASRGEVRAVDERLELTLADGTVLKLAGIDPAAPTPSDPSLDLKSKARLAAWLVGRKVLYRALDDRRDRWGRLPALVFAENGAREAAPVSVAATVLDAGLGRFEPSDLVRACRSYYLAVEGAARKAKLGLWRDPYYAIVEATDRDALAELSGTMAIVEGEVTGVEADAYRTTLYFGSRRGGDFSVVVLQRNIDKLEAAGWDLDRLRGQILRARGLLDARFGPRIEISGPDDLELVATAPDDQASDSIPAPAIEQKFQAQ